MTDTLETAAACGVSLRPRRADEPSLAKVPAPAGTPTGSFDALIDSWFPLTYVLNNLNRGLGLPDAYPFVLSPPARREAALRPRDGGVGPAGQLASRASPSRAAPHYAARRVIAAASAWRGAGRPRSRFPGRARGCRRAPWPSGTPPRRARRTGRRRACAMPKSRVVELAAAHVADAVEDLLLPVGEVLREPVREQIGFTAYGSRSSA